MMTAFGYYPYSEPGLGNGIILAWGIFFNILAWGVLIFQQSATGVYINEAYEDEGTLTRFLSTMSLRSSSSNSFKGLVTQTVASASNTEVPASEKSFSNLKALPRMIQQKSQLLGDGGDDDDSSSVASNTNSRVKSMQYRALSITHDEDLDNPTNPPQIQKVQSMFVSLPRPNQAQEFTRPKIESSTTSGIIFVEDQDPQISGDGQSLESFLNGNGTHVEEHEGLFGEQSKRV
jgi:hypothetical protein